MVAKVRSKNKTGIEGGHPFIRPNMTDLYVGTDHRITEWTKKEAIRGSPLSVLEVS